MSIFSRVVITLKHGEVIFKVYRDVCMIINQRLTYYVRKPLMNDWFQSEIWKVIFKLNNNIVIERSFCECWLLKVSFIVFCVSYNSIERLCRSLGRRTMVNNARLYVLIANSKEKDCYACKLFFAIFPLIQVWVFLIWKTCIIMPDQYPIFWWLLIFY